jgi:DNA-binding FrmR family transcriptional regulator
MSIKTEPELSQQARTRLRRIEGQVRGLQGMLDKLQGCGDGPGEPCDSLLNQVLAVRAAVEQVGLIMLELHLQRCVLNGVDVDDETVTSLRDSIKRWSRLGSA